MRKFTKPILGLNKIAIDVNRDKIGIKQIAANNVYSQNIQINDLNTNIKIFDKTRKLYYSNKCDNK